MNVNIIDIMEDLEKKLYGNLEDLICVDEYYAQDFVLYIKRLYFLKHLDRLATSLMTLELP